MSEKTPRPSAESDDMAYFWQDTTWSIVGEIPHADIVLRCCGADRRIAEAAAALKKSARPSVRSEPAEEWSRIAKGPWTELIETQRAAHVAHLLRISGGRIRR